MKKVLTLIAAYAICTHIAYAQADESRDFLYLYSDSVVYANHVDIERDITGSFYLWVNSRRVQPDRVKFFNNHHGFFANIRDFDISGETAFAERIRKGKVNLFEAKKIYWDAYDELQFYPPQPTVNERKNFYNIGYGPLKKASYVNLSIDLASNPKSMAFLQKYGSVKTTQTAMYIAAGVSFIAGILAVNWKTDKGFGDMDPRKPMSSNDSGLDGAVAAAALWGVGLGLATGGYLIGPSKSRYLKQAIDAYNE